MTSNQEALQQPAAPVEKTVDAAGEESRPEWTMLLWVGPGDAPVRGDTRSVNLTPAGDTVEETLEALSGSGLTPSDLRSRVLFVADPSEEYRTRALTVYAALCGFAGRRLDAEVSGGMLTLTEFDRMLRGAADAGRPDEIVEQAQVGGVRDDMRVADLSGGFTPEALSVIRFARRLRFVAPDNTALALTQLVAVAAVRARAGMDRFPMLVTGDEPFNLPVNEDNTVGAVGVCLHHTRRGAEQLRRSMRGDTRDAVADFVEPSPRQRRLLDAAGVGLEDVLARLGVKSKIVESMHPHPETGDVVEEVAWHCPKPSNHTNGDANPSGRILPSHDGTPGFRCFRCLHENVDALRLVMWARDLSVDEAADWILTR